MTQEQPKPLLFCYFGFEMQSQPQRTRGVCLQAGGVGTLAFLLPPVACAHMRVHTHRPGAICSHKGFAFSPSRTGPGSQGYCSGLKGSGALATLGVDFDWSQL